MAMQPFARRVNKEIIGCPRPFNACADPIVCNGMGIYLQIVNRMVSAAHWWCGECSDAERQGLEVACQLAVGKDLASVHALGVGAFEAIAEPINDDLRLAWVRVLLALEMALVDYEVKKALAASASQPIDATQKLKQLGFVARPGQQRLKQVLEDELVRYNLRVPTVKTQEWTAFGTLEDCSRWVQSAIKTTLLNEVMERCYPVSG
jgi:hypothetical protein